MDEITRLLPPGTPYRCKGEEKESSAAVALDLTSYNKHPDGRGGQWRLPGCIKTDKDGKPKAGSLPQSPVAEHLAEMPWLAPLTPAALGSDWTLGLEV